MPLLHTSRYIIA